MGYASTMWYFICSSVGGCKYKRKEGCALQIENKL